MRPVSVFGPLRFIKSLGRQYYANKPGNLNIVTGEFVTPTIGEQIAFSLSEYGSAYFDLAIDAAIIDATALTDHWIERE
jgi:hypothetical protein